MKPRHLILMLLALITSINVSAYTWTDANGTEWNFTTWGSKATITNRGYNNNNGNYIPSISGTIPTELTIPTTVYNGVTAYTVTSIGNNAFSGCSSLTSVTIPEGVTSIGEWAFDNCTSLTSITIPEGVTSIGVVAFYYCSGLTSITIPEGVTSIGGRAFEGCSSLTSITIPNSVTSIGDYAFSDCSSLTSITIPESVTSIGNYAFCSCSSLTSITIPESVTSIGNYAFCSCSSLTSITISEGVTRIGNNAFSGCTRLTSINIPESVTSIGDYAFYQCSSLNSVNIPSTVTSIGQTAFGQTYMIVNFASTSPCTQGGLTESVRLVVPHESVDAYREAWSDISNAIVDATQTEKDITVTASESESAVAVEIGEDKLINVLKLKVTGTINSYDLMVFRNKMVNLVDLDLSDANVVANSYCYYSTISSKDNIVTSHFVPSTIKSLKLPKDITAMDGGALGGCNCITSISIPEGVKSIGNSAFYKCI